ncbi:MAG TPA: hypothetical protein VKT52_12550, partial [Ktedonobacterales bacterium]|nr:hypothetical protein [Ktedonobacterales bacterium]
MSDQTPGGEASVIGQHRPPAAYSSVFLSDTLLCLLLHNVETERQDRIPRGKIGLARSPLVERDVNCLLDRCDTNGVIIYTDGPSDR